MGREHYAVNTVLDTMTVAEAAELIGENEALIRAKAREGRFKYLKPGRKIQIVRRSFMKWWHSTGTGLG